MMIVMGMLPYLLNYMNCCMRQDEGKVQIKRTCCSNFQKTAICLKSAFLLLRSHLDTTVAEKERLALHACQDSAVAVM